MSTYEVPNCNILWNQLPYGMLIVTPDALIVGWEGEMENWFVYKKDEIFEKSLFDVLPFIYASYKSFCQIGEDYWETELKSHMHALRGEWKRYKENGIHIVDFLVLRQDDQYFELENIFDTSFDEILVTDGDGRILRVGSKSEQLYHCSAKQMLGKKTTEIAGEGAFTPSFTQEIIDKRARVSGVQITASGQKLHVIGNPVFNPDGSIRRIIFNSREYEEAELLRERLETTENLLDAYRSELKKLRQTNEEPQTDMVVLSSEMRKIYQLAERMALIDSTVLIVGESGVGKGMIAQKLHRASHRLDKNFVHINCGAIPETLIESELFGYEKGAFTGAHVTKKGVLEISDGGTVFLDEIGELPLNVQVKLLQFLQENTFRRLGSNQQITINTRVIAATNRDLRELIKQGRFREDLFYRLNVIPIFVPPLRERKEEIPPLVQHFLANFTRKYKLFKYFHKDTLEILKSYDWPGNVRELENMVERLMVTSEGAEILPEHLPSSIWEEQRGQPRLTPLIKIKELYPLKQAVEEVERQLITMAYKKYENTYRCAEVLKVNQSTVVRKMNKYLGTGREEKL
ncbi:sigma-54 interaction domain-containing protein [Aneurinibacillus terranovensis]|uniref:sigma-54 interaction domain-containing protein n=1 Tax=Aneurinibacillus terranovensis TaxID=278991 RepID=UPI00068914EF|nr:sigma 54-interacting transcriptional regulator [Aneurinibacillus terranovensis]